MDRFHLSPFDSKISKLAAGGAGFTEQTTQQGQFAPGARFVLVIQSEAFIQ
jgi:hypothetical protein